MPRNGNEITAALLIVPPGLKSGQAGDGLHRELPIWQARLVDTLTRESLELAGSRLRLLRNEYGWTLAQVSEMTGISISTLSRLESGQRKATLELLIPLAHIYRVSLDHLVSVSSLSEYMVNGRPPGRDGLSFVSLTHDSKDRWANKVTLHRNRAGAEPQAGIHDGYEWIYVLSGRVRLVLGGRELTLESGEAAEFDTRTPHWFGNADQDRAEVLVLFDGRGDPIRFRARPTTSRASAK